jgi:hypothetical protein
MKANLAQMNLWLAWAGILLGFLSGLYLGLSFHREDWLGGYGSFKRRLYRLAHISFFGLGAVNLLFFLTVRSLAWAGRPMTIASWGFIVGAFSMPVCCLVLAHRPRALALFGLPVISLVLGGILTLVAVVEAL